MTVNYSKTSPYYSTKQTSWFLSNYIDRGFTSDPSDYDFTITARYHNRPDLLANDLYGRSSLWWLFILTNDFITDPIFDMTSGTTIKVPLPTRVSQFFE